MRGIEVAQWGGANCARKRYPASETSAYKCFGSGCGNEGLLPPSLTGHVPRLLGMSRERRGDRSYDEVSYLELLNGSVLQPEEMGPERARRAGRLLSAIHSADGPWFGSLNGAYRYDSWSASWQPRWRVMTSLVSTIDPALAARLYDWGVDMIQACDDGSPPTLVHGDFGPSNLLWSDDRSNPWIIDWEHARFGHPAEDLAKLQLAELFPEPNGFSTGTFSIFDAVRSEWADSIGRHCSAGREILLLAYYAGTLGVFLDGPSSPRLNWLRDMLNHW